MYQRIPKAEIVNLGHEEESPRRLVKITWASVPSFASEGDLDEKQRCFCFVLFETGSLYVA